MNVRYRVELSEIERAELATLLRGGRRAARTLKRAQILLAADAGESEQAIARHVAVSASTVCRTKRRFVEGNLERALSEEPRPGAARLLSGREEALLVATACSKPPMGRSRWTLELLAGEVVRLTGPDSLSRETVRRRLAENDLKPWREKMWCIPRVDGDFVARMEDVLDLYAEQPDPNFPVVCFDESSIQMLGEIREPIAAASGRPRRVDYEYRRHGTMMLFVMVDAHRPWRRVMLSEQRTGLEFALGMRALVDREYPHAPRIRVVLDNLSTHTPAALYQAFPAAEARRILRRLEFHSTPSMPVGSIWWRSRSASSKASAWTGASAIRKCSRPRSPPGRARVTARARASAGCSRPKKPGPRWAGLIPSQPLPMDRSNRQNLCERVLVS